MMRVLKLKPRQNEAVMAGLAPAGHDDAYRLVI
jgi:hypothetical protein